MEESFNNSKFSFSERIHRKKEFAGIIASGNRIYRNFLTIIFLKNTARSARLGLVTKRNIGGAVVRNKIKRRLREIFRTNKSKIILGTDFVFIPKPEITKLKYRELETQIMKMLESKGLMRAAK